MMRFVPHRILPGYSTLGIPGLLKVIQGGGCVLRHFEFDQLPQSHVVVVAQRAVQLLAPADAQQRASSAAARRLASR
jgi:hypothetical protein